MNFLEVIPGRDIGKLHILKKVGNLNGEECFLCRDERGRNIQFVESEIIAQAGEGPEIVEEEVVEETPEESVLESLMSKPIEELEGQEIVTILIGVYDDNPPDDLTVEELRHRLAEAGKQEAPKEEKKEEPKKSILDKVFKKNTGKGGK